MFDKFNQTLSFAADPPEGGGGTKTKIGGVGSSLTSESTSVDPPALPADPPEGSGGTEVQSTQSASSSTATE